jgi:hypothetical protein
MNYLSSIEGKPVETSLVERALEVIDANWLGHATRPSPRLYPHQWSWDSAFAAMGYAGHDQSRAEAELHSLFAGQWSNGLLPHIVFVDDGEYFPGPEFWQTERTPEAPAGVRTSGIVQPPIHATAALTLYRRANDRAQARTFLGDMFPRLAAWHEYLYRERRRESDGLVEIWHPWESGMDNSPIWDAALANVALPAAGAPLYQRLDVEAVGASGRPSDGEYDRYAYLVHHLRERAYRADAIRADAPFVLQPVLFNALLVQADRDLGEIAEAVGADSASFRGRADATAEAIERLLWDEQSGMYADRDVRAGTLVPSRSAAGFAPMYAGIPDVRRARRLLERLHAHGVGVPGGFAVTSVAPDDPGFRPELYWRGPIWPVLNWLAYRGSLRYGEEALARSIRAAVLELARANGFWEHYNPATAGGQGGQTFTWTAAIVLDLLADDRQDDEGRTVEHNRTRRTT